MKSSAKALLQRTAIALLFLSLLLFFGVAHVEGAFSPPRTLVEGASTAVSANAWWETTFSLSGNPKEFLQKQVGQFTANLLDNFFVNFVRDTFNNAIFGFVKWTASTPLRYIFFSGGVLSIDDAKESMFLGFVNVVIGSMVIYSFTDWTKKTTGAVKSTIHSTYVFLCYFSSDSPKDARYRVAELNFYWSVVSSYFNCIQDNMSLFAFSQLIFNVLFLFIVTPLRNAPELRIGNTTETMPNLMERCDIAVTESTLRTFHSYDYFFIYVINVIGSGAMLMKCATWPIIHVGSAVFSMAMHGMQLLFVWISSGMNRGFFPLAVVTLGRAVAAYSVHLFFPSSVLTAVGIPTVEVDVWGTVMRAITDESCQTCWIISMLVHALACVYSASKNPYNKLDTKKSQHLWWLKMSIPLLVGSGMLAYTLVTHPGKLTHAQQFSVCHFGVKSNSFIFGVALLLLFWWARANPKFYTDETDETDEIDEIDEIDETGSTAGQGGPEPRLCRTLSAESVTC